MQKVRFLLGGNGLAGWTEEFRRDGFRGGTLTALAAGGGQLGAGLFLATGLLTPMAATTPMAAMTAMGVMTVASTVKWRNGLWVQNDGYEYPLVLVLVAAVLALTGPGRWSGDEVLGFAPWPLWVSVAAVLLGPVAGPVAGLATRAVLHRPVPAAEPGEVTGRA